MRVIVIVVCEVQQYGRLETEKRRMDERMPERR
jgi:hypothetical protein